MSHWTILCALACVLLFATVVEGDINNPCVDSTWTGPSADNKFNCDNGDRWSKFIREKMALPLFLMICAWFTFLACPWIFCFRYCCQCCGGSRQRPDNCCCGSSVWDQKPEQERFAAYSRFSIRVTKLATVLLAIAAVVSVGVSYSGAGDFGKGLDSLSDGFSANIAWIRSIITDLKNGIRRDDGTYPMDMTKIYDIENRLDSTDRDYQRNYKDHRNISKDITYGLGYATIIPCVFLMMALLPAACNIRICIPALLIMFYFLLAFVYLFAGSLFYLINVPVNMVCDEVTLQTNRQPGVMQWYVIPKCKRDGPLETARSRLDTAESNAAADACNSLRSYCDEYTMYGGGSTRPFYCKMTYPANCSDFAGINEVARTARIKDGYSESCGGNSPCTVAKCASYCTDSVLKSRSLQFNNSLSDANRVMSTVRRVVYPWLDCNTLVDKILQNVPVCDKFPKGFDQLGFACSFAGFLLLGGIIVLFMGQKRFINPDKYNDVYLNGDVYSNPNNLQSPYIPAAAAVEMQREVYYPGAVAQPAPGMCPPPAPMPVVAVAVPYNPPPPQTNAVPYSPPPPQAGNAPYSPPPPQADNGGIPDVVKPYPTAAV